MEIRVLLFASLREAAGASELNLSLPDGSSASDVLARMACIVPRYDPLLQRCALAVNAEYAGPEQVLHE